MQQADSEQRTFWYYQTADQVVGPVMAVRLCQLARQGKLLAHDKVRKGQSGDWVDAGTVEMLEIDQAAAQPVRPVAASPPPRPVVVPQARFEFTRKLKDLYDNLVERLSDGGQFLLRIVYAVLPPVVVVGLMATTVLITWDFIRKLEIDWSTPPDPLAIYQSVWKEFQQKRNDRVSDKEWDEFAERSGREIAVAVAWLEKHATSTDPESQILLRAGRDCLPQMFKDSRERSTRTEWFFRNHLSSIDQVRKGIPLDQRQDRYKLVRRQLQASINMQLIGVITFFLLDVLIVGWLVRFWLKKRSEGQTLFSA